MNLTTHLNLSLSDECVCGFAQLSGAAALVHMQQILLVLRLRDGTRSLLWLGWTGVCGHYITQQQVQMHGHKY